MGIFRGNAETTRLHNVQVNDNPVKYVYHYFWAYESGKGIVSKPIGTHNAFHWDALSEVYKNWVRNNLNIVETL